MVPRLIKAIFQGIVCIDDIRYLGKYKKDYATIVIFTAF